MNSAAQGDESRTLKPGRVDLAWLLAVCAAGIVWTAFYFDRGLDAFDAGLFATEAQRILEGGIYGKEFIAPYGPGRYYLIALLFSLFGSSLKVQALLWLGLRGIVASLVFATGRTFLPRIVALLPAFIVIAAPGALHKSFFQLAALLNILGYFYYRKHPSLLSCGLAGLVIAAGSLFRVDAGFFGAVSFLLLLCIEPFWCRNREKTAHVMKRAAAFLLGASVLLVPVFLYFLATTNVSEIFQAEWHRTQVVSAFQGYLHVPAVSEALEADYPASEKLLLAALMLRAAPWTYALLALVVIVGRLRGRDPERSIMALALVLFGVPLLNQVRITPTFNHLLHALPLILVSWVVSIRLLMNSCVKARTARVSGALLLIVVPLAIPVYYNLAHTRGVLPGSLLGRNEFTEPVALERAGVFETPDQARNLEKVVNYIQATTKPGEPVFAGPFIPVLNFLADRPPAIRFMEPFYYFRSEALQKKVIHDLAVSRPRLVVLDPDIQVGNQSLQIDAPLVHDFIRRNYLQVFRAGDQTGPYSLWLLRE